MTTRTTNDDLRKRIRQHAMFSESDLRYLRAKGYDDEQILAFWDRDHRNGKSPVNHRVAFEFEGIELPSAGQAIQHANADPRYDTPILLGGKHYAIARETGHRLEAMGVGFAYLGEHERPDGQVRLITIPVND